MSVFPSARRALARPSRLPWLIAAVAILATVFTYPTYSLLHETASRVSSPLVADTSSSDSRVVRLPEASTNTAPLLTAAQSQQLADGMSSDVQMAAEEAWFIVPRPAPVDANDAQTGYISEISSAAVAPGPSSATASTEADSSTTTESTVPVPAPQTAAEVPPVAQPAAPAFVNPIDRWAAAGIDIETQGQLLDDASLANVDAALSAVPPSLLSSLGNPAFGPLHILVNTEGRVLSGDQPYGGPANFFSTNDGTNELVLYPQQSVFTIVHELGHAYNLRHVGAGRYAMVLLDPEMQSFLAATGWTINSTDDEIRNAVDHMHVSYTYNGSFHWPRLSNDDPLEDFANSFASYFLDPNGLQQESPARYAWMAATFG